MKYLFLILLLFIGCSVDSNFNSNCVDGYLVQNLLNTQMVFFCKRATRDHGGVVGLSCYNPTFKENNEVFLTNAMTIKVTCQNLEGLNK